jgi:hypothetical protein
MKNPIRSIDRQRMLWESTSEESPAVLGDEQQKELMNALMELLLSSVAESSAKDSDGGINDGE